MGIVLTRREYENQFRAEKTSWLLGNVGDIITLELDFEIEINSVSSYSVPFTSNGSNEFSRSTGSFFNDGFTVGTSISWATSYGPTGSPVSQTGTATISVLTPTLMRLTGVVGTFPTAFSYPFNDGTNEGTPITIESGDPIEGALINYNFISNDDITSASLNSLVDGTTPTFKADGIDPTDTITQVPLNPIGFTSGISLINAYIVGGGVVGITQSFTVSLNFQIMPLFDNLSDFQNGVAPSFLFDVNSLTDVFDITFLPEIGNPNVKITTNSSQVALLGNVGWFGENLNGTPSLYSKIGVSYSRTNGTSATGIQIDDPTNFTVQINQPGNTPTSKYKFGFAFVPFDKSLISNNDKFNYENILYNGLDVDPLDESTTPFLYFGAENDEGAAMHIGFDSVTSSGDTVSISGQFQPNSAFQPFFESINSSNWNFIIWVSAGDESLATNVSDRVSILCDFNQFIEQPTTFVLGDVDTQFLNHAQSIGNGGVEIYNGCVEDEILSDSIMFLDTANNESVDSINFIIEGFNTVSGDVFDCERYSIDTSGFAVDGSGVQQINVQTTRSFRMASGVEKNLIEVVRDSSIDVGTKLGYRLRYAFRPRWEYWIKNSKVPNDFLNTDSTEQNGLNQDWSRIDSLFTDWKLRFSIETELNSNGSVVNTRNSENVFVRTYEESNVWDGEITHFNESGITSLFIGVDGNGIRNNAILQDDKTLIQADFDLEDVGGDVGDISLYYGVIRIEKFEQGGINGIEMLSTILDNTNQILKPIATEAKCKIEKISLTKIRLTGLIDNSFLNTGSNYKTSARIGFTNFVIPGVYGEQYGPQYD